MKPALVQPLASAAIGAVGSYPLYGYGKLGIAGIGVPSPLLFGALAGGSTALNAVTRDYILPKVLPKGTTIQTVQMIASPALTGANMVLLGFVLGGFQMPTITGAAKLFGLGALSEIGSYYAAQSLAIGPGVPPGARAGTATARPMTNRR